MAKKKPHKKSVFKAATASHAPNVSGVNNKASDFAVSPKAPVSTNNKDIKPDKELQYNLPIESIKKDLLKNFVYTLFAIGFIIFLKTSPFGFEFFKSILHF